MTGMLQIARLNWPRYVAGAAMILLAAIAGSLKVTPPVAWVLIIGAVLAAWWMIASLIVSHIVYDRSKLCEWKWLEPVIGFTPTSWIDIHAGLDESSATLRRMWPNARGRVFDIFSAREMTERSIHRARAQSPRSGEHVDYRQLPVTDDSCDAAMLLLSAHELREHESRAALFRELRRALMPDGKIVLAEHLRDFANFAAFGPGFLHFHSRRSWLAAAEGFALEKEFRITPFVTVFILRRTP